MSSEDEIQCGETTVQNEDESREEETIQTSNQPLALDTATTLPSTSADSDDSSEHNMVLKSPIRKFFEERKLVSQKLKNMEIKTSAIDSIISKNANNPEHILTDHELDCIQFELESIISSLTVRGNIIRNEHHSLISFQLGTALPSASDYPELAAIKAEASATENVLPENNFYNRELEFVETPPIPSESASNFWSFVEPYLAHVTKNDIKWLNDLVESYNKPLCAIPPLGKYYANNCTQKESNIKKQSRSRPFTKLPEQVVSPDVINLVNKINNIVRDENASTSMYQNISAALLENSQKDIKENLSEHDSEGEPQEISDVYKDFRTEQDISEQLHKTELVGHHVIGNSDDCDEILEELNKCDAALAELQKMNKDHLIELLGRCRKDYYLETVKSKIKNLDRKILNLKKQNKSIKENKITLKSLLTKRKKYLAQLKSETFEISDDLNTSVSEDSDSVTHKEHVKVIHPNIDVKLDDTVDNE